MNSELLFEGKTYVSVSRASKKLGYTADYIGQLCRAGKIDAKFIGRTWYVEWNSLKNHKQNKKKRVRRTAEEIRREREGLTQTVYVMDEELPQTESTTNENLSDSDDKKLENNLTYNLPVSLQSDEDCPPEEYLKTIDNKNFSLDQVEKKSILISQPEIQTESKVVVDEDRPSEEYLNKIDGNNHLAFFPETQETWLPKLIKKESEIVSPYVNQKKYSPKFANKIAGVLILIFVFTTTSSWLSFTEPQFVKTAILPRVQTLQNEMAIFFNPNGTQLATVTTTDFDKSKNLSSVIGTLQNSFSYVLNGLKSRVNHMALIYMKSLGFVPESEINSNSNPGRIGLVVVPDDPNHEATVATIKNSFSDQVDVQTDTDPTSGIIVPQFKTVKDTPYTYVMVPINSP